MSKEYTNVATQPFTYGGCSSTGREKVKVDVIIPVHNAESTIVETIVHVCNQRFPSSADECLYRTNNNQEYYHSFDLDVTICCHDDGSEDQSLALLYDLQGKIEQQQHAQSDSNADPNPSAPDKAVVSVRQLLISSSDVSRGAGFARNQAASLPHRHHRGEYLAMLDADDIMLPTRLVEQVAYLRHLTKDLRDRTLLGCHFQRDPPDSTWHYTQWANSLSDDRLLLERFREVTILQPTWMISRRRFEVLGGYITTPCNSTANGNESIIDSAVVDQNPTASPTQSSGVYHLISPLDTVSSLRLAEDLRFFYAHLAFHYNHESILQDKSCFNHYPSVYGGDGLLKLVGSSPLELNAQAPSLPTSRLVEDNYNGIIIPEQPGQDLFTLSGYQSTQNIKPLTIYRHLPGCTQSARTSRKLLMQLRVKAFEDLVLRSNTLAWNEFAIWGAGRDGKEFFKYLSPSSQGKDEKKINRGFYTNKELPKKQIPIVHFTVLRRESYKQEHDCVEQFSQIIKRKCESYKNPTTFAVKKRHNANEAFRHLPVVVCVAMYRTNGALESNVKSIARQEGVDLWHFS